MDGQPAAGALECLVEILGVLQAVDLLRDVKLRFIRRVLRRRVAEDQNRKLHPAVSQLHSLFQIRDRQILRAEGLKRPADLHGAVSVGIGLHDAQKARPFSDVLAQRPIVMLQVVQRDICPGSFE